VALPIAEELITDTASAVLKLGEWAQVLEQKPDAAVVTDAKLRAEIERTGLPWRVKDKGTGIELLLVPPGKYQRGASVGDGDAESDEKPAHYVMLTQPFYLGRYEVTQAQWQAAMGSNPSTRSKDTQAPVETVSHDDIFKFNQKTGLRLPTEAEWEYACRAGSMNARYGELDAIAWYAANSGSTTRPVGQKRANALGFHDMLGNVWEWCSDWYSDSGYARCSGGVVDPIGPSTGDSRVMRGGSCYSDFGLCRASNRNGGGPANRNISVGFRASRTLGFSVPSSPLPSSSESAPPTKSAATPDARLPWAEVLEQQPDAAVVTDANLRAEIERTGLPWRVKDKGTGIELLLVPPGKYQRGASVRDGDALSDQKPAHDVMLTQPFYLGRYEVTQAQWQAVMGSTPSTKSKDPQAPVETVSHDDIANFNQKTGLRLPTEAEWEYACRAGSTAARYGELDAVAWHSGNSGSTTHPVGQKRANALGFHDMLGNVWEWCSDWYSDSEYARCAGGVVDPTGPSTGEFRVLRGDAYHANGRSCRASARFGGAWPTHRWGFFGFRAARNPEPESQ
jgi:formylglycine-generating enzyme required for sulfatase activity